MGVQIQPNTSAAQRHPAQPPPTKFSDAKQAESSISTVYLDEEDNEVEEANLSPLLTGVIPANGTDVKPMQKVIHDAVGMSSNEGRGYEYQ